MMSDFTKESSEALEKLLEEDFEITLKAEDENKEREDESNREEPQDYV